METHFRYKGGQKPPTTGFATPHVAGVPEHEPDQAVNDSLGTVHPADTMDTDPKDEPEARSKQSGIKRHRN